MSFFNKTVLLIFFFCLGTYAGDWPRFLGPNDNDIVKPESGFNPDLKQWEKAWEIKIGQGYSALAVAGDKAYTLGHDGKETETIYCLDANTGKEIWKHSYKGLLINKLHIGGPNATTTIEGDVLYSISKDGQVFCLNRNDGKVLWAQNIHKAYGIKQPNFGYAGSPVIYEDWVLLTCGKACALEKKTGKIVWISEVVDKEESSYHPGHATPVVFEKGSKKYILLQLGTGIEVLNLKDGKRVVRHNLKADYNMTAVTPTVFDNGSKILISWNKYSEMIQFDGSALSKGWKNKEYEQTMQNYVKYGDVIYGVTGNNSGKRTKFVAFEAATGKNYWQKKGFKWAQVIGIGDTLLCMDIKGDLVTVKADKSKFEEISRITILDSICWTKATYANNKIYVRNDKGRVICLKIK